MEKPPVPAENSIDVHASLRFFGVQLNAGIFIGLNALVTPLSALEEDRRKVTDALWPFFRFAESTHWGRMKSACYAARRS